MLKKVLLISISLALVLLCVTGCRCLWAWTEIQVNRDVQATRDNFISAKDINLCSGESALLKWNSNQRFTQVVVSPNIGEVNNSGQVVVSPAQTTEYMMEAQGDNCKSTSRATVHVVRPGDQILLSSTEIYDSISEDYHWQVTPKEQIYSPNVMVNSIRAGTDTNKVAPWTVTVKNQSGVVNEFTVPEDRWTSPSPRFSIVGTWNLWPDKNYEGEANFLLEIDCQ